MFLEQIFIKGLGCMSYVIGCKDSGDAVVVDPDRDINVYLRIAEREGLHFRWIIETHLHADHVSGNTTLAHLTGAQIAIHADAEVAYPHRTLRDGDTLSIGHVRLHVRHTPGHTPDSISLAVVDTTRGEQPCFLMTGDTLFVGDVGRPDLVGGDSAPLLAHKLFDSLFNVLLHYDQAAIVYPGHGSGSLCGRSIGDSRLTTLGYENQFNRALQTRDLPQFVSTVTERLPVQPGNHSWIKHQNINGPSILETVTAHELSVDDVRRELDAGAVLLDLRSLEAHQQLTLAKTAWLPPDEQMANRVGFVIPAGTAVILILDDPAAYREQALTLARVSFDHILGYVHEGTEALARSGMKVWRDRRRDLSAHELADKLNDLEPLTVVDVREPWEYAEGHVPGALNIPLIQVAERVHELPLNQPIAVICEGGDRSIAGAALVDRFAAQPAYNVADGTRAWRERHATA